MQYCSLQHQTLFPSQVTSTTRHCFALALFLHSSGVISPLISSSILGTCQPGEFIFQCPIFLPFHTVHGVLKARILKWFSIPFSSGPHFVRVWRLLLLQSCPTLEWVSISSSNAWKWKMKVKSLSRVRLFTTPWTVAHQAPPPIGFSRREHCSGLPYKYWVQLPVPYAGPCYLFHI